MTQTLTIRHITSLLTGALCLAILAVAIPSQASPGSKHNSAPQAPTLHQNSRRATRRAAAPHRQTTAFSQPDLAEAVLSDALEQLWDQRDVHFHKGEYNHIINLGYVIAQGDPRRVDTYGDNAYLLWSTDRNDAAIAFLKQGLKANPDNYYMYDELGTHYLIHLHDAKTATPYFEQAVKFRCPYTTWHSLAHCYEKTNQWEKAVGAWEKATSYPNDPLARQRLDRARAELAKQKGSG